jgi:hypothetical protein
VRRAWTAGPVPTTRLSRSGSIASSGTSTHIVALDQTPRVRNGRLPPLYECQLADDYPQDITGDNVIDINDLLEMLGDWGSECPEID